MIYEITLKINKWRINTENQLQAPCTHYIIKLVGNVS